MKPGKAIAIKIVGLFSFSRSLSVIVLHTIGWICKMLPDGKWKAYIVNGLNSISWKEIDLLPQKVLVGNKTSLYIKPHPGEFDFSSLIWQRLPYEPELYDYLDKVIGKYDLILDIGANVGIFSIYAGKKAGTRVYSFEPSNEAYYRLNQNIRANRISSISAYNAAVSDTTGFMSFYEPSGHLTNGSLQQSFAEIFDKNPSEKQVISFSGELLENFVKGRERVLIKIDTEGAESFVLKSLQAFISNVRPDIILEVLSSYEKQLNELEFITRNYTIFRIEPGHLAGTDRFIAHDSFRDCFLQFKES
jgi:FkbM family methyltransferase